MRFSLAIFIIILEGFAFGSETTGGNGNETYFAHANPWFVGNEPILYCIHVDDNLSRHREAFAATIRKSISAWTEFLKFYGIDQLKFGQGPYYFPDRKSYGMATTFLEASSIECEGGSPRLLHFAYGAPKFNFEQYLKLGSWANGIALPNKVSPTERWHGGTIWINPFLHPAEPEFSYTLTHELGHVFGFKHNTLPVMQQKSIEALPSCQRSYRYMNPDAIEMPNSKFAYVVGQSYLLSFSNLFSIPLSPPGLLRFPPCSAVSTSGPSKTFVEKMGLDFRAINVRLEIDATDEDSGEIYSTLLLSDAQDKVARLSSQFKTVTSSPKLSSPELCFYWKLDNEKTVAYCDSIFKSKLGTHANGWVRINNSKYPAHLRFETGLSLSIYVDEDWWEIN
jgi:hypothetical protein